MIRAYDKIYLDKARTALGRMLDFAVYDLKYDISDFFELFIRSGLAASMVATRFPPMIMGTTVWYFAASEYSSPNSTLTLS